MLSCHETFLPLFFRLSSSISECNPLRISWCSLLTKASLRLSSKILAWGSWTGDGDAIAGWDIITVEPRPEDRALVRLEPPLIEVWVGDVVVVDSSSRSPWFNWKQIILKLRNFTLKLQFFLLLIVEQNVDKSSKPDDDLNKLMFFNYNDE